MTTESAFKVKHYPTKDYHEYMLQDLVLNIPKFCKIRVKPPISFEIPPMIVNF